MEARSEGWDAALEALRADGLLRRGAACFLPAHEPPWRATGVVPAAGEAVSWLASGRIRIPGMPRFAGGPRYHLWGRFGPEGPVWNGTQETTTRVAPGGRELELGILQGEWADVRGAPGAPPEAWAALEGGFDVRLFHWAGGVDVAREGLRRFAARTGDAAAGAERARLAAPVPPPPGWRYLWQLGESEIFRTVPCEARGSPTIAVAADADVGILQHPLAEPLACADDTCLAWSWRVDELPSREPEDALPCHDYVSIAAEFACGRDLTWYWSASLPEGAHYTCPIPHWAPREHHFVVRSGGAGLGRWHREERRIAEDYRAVHGGPVPPVVAVWLIAVAIFQGGRVRARFGEVELRGGGGQRRVL